MFSFALAESMDLARQQREAINSINNSEIGQEIREQIRENIQERQNIKEQIKELKKDLKENIQERREIKRQIKGEYISFEDDGKGLKIRSKNHSARTMLNLSEQKDENNNTIITFKMKNGTEREIKIMPDTAAERALERLRLKVCNETNNCTIQLKEVGKENKEKAKYEMQVQRHYKLLGLFRAKAENKAEVDVETGDVVVTKKPWWSFLAKESE